MTKCFSTLFLTALLFGAALICNAQPKVNDTAFPQEAVFVNIANTETIHVTGHADVSTGYRFAEFVFQPGQLCIIIPGEQITVLGMFKDDVLAKVESYHFNGQLGSLQCPKGAMFFIAHAVFAGMPKAPPEDTEVAERKAFVQKFEQQYDKMIADEAEAKKPPACKALEAFEQKWYQGSAEDRNDKKAVKDYLARRRPLKDACWKQQQNQK